MQLLDDKRFDGNAKHQLAGEPLLRLAVALLSPVSSQANWRTWLAQTPEDAVGMNQESARGALLRVVVRGPMAADTIDVKIAGWRVNKYVLPGDGRVFLASRVGADVQRNLSPETETVVLYFNPSHERIPLGKITEAYMKMIRGQYDKATDTFLKGRG